MNPYLRAGLAVFSPYAVLCVGIVKVVEGISGQPIPAIPALLMGGAIGAIGLGPLVLVVGDDIEEREFRSWLAGEDGLYEPPVDR